MHALKQSRNFQCLEYDQTGLLYTRQVTCPHCECRGSAIEHMLAFQGRRGSVGYKRWYLDGRKKTVPLLSGLPFRVTKGKGPRGRESRFRHREGRKGNLCPLRTGYRSRGNQAPGQGRVGIQDGKTGSAPWPPWRFQPKLTKPGRLQRFVTGARAGKIKTEKIRFFRPPNGRDLKALEKAEKMLAENWDRWEDMGLIPTEKIPEGHKTKEPLRAGYERWCDLFTPRQLLGHLTLVEELNRLKPLILKELGPEKGKAVVTYLQFALDKGLDYNGRQTMWHASRGVIAHVFTRHDYSFKWTFGEMVFSGPNSGAAWGLSQILDAYKGIAALLEPVHKSAKGNPPLMLLNGTAASMPSIGNKTVEVICFDPPYYNNVQYGELSDYFYVWQAEAHPKDLPRTHRIRRLVNKEDEAVANPDRDGGEQKPRLNTNG